MTLPQGRRTYTDQRILVAVLSVPLRLFKYQYISSSIYKCPSHSEALNLEMPWDSKNASLLRRDVSGLPLEVWDAQ